ncbi:DUF4145 domain-containing protein [Clostridium butyricum]|uniref:DUF4145 domain-containing protein n=1 Tax=Clostridium butyricum TaxID=1492 RepID=UPI00325BC77B
MLNDNEGWLNCDELKPRIYTCGVCGKEISSNRGYRYLINNGYSYDETKYIYLCHNCNSPTCFDVYNEEQIPGVLYGDDILYLPETVEKAYNEARKCFSVNAFTSVVLCCRKLLMNISCESGAKEGLKFVQYIDYLKTEGYIPKNAEPWVDKIRLLGNDGTHKIEDRSEEDAKLSIQFISTVLKMMYEMPGRLNDI